MIELIIFKLYYTHHLAWIYLLACTFHDNDLRPYKILNYPCKFQNTN